MYQQIKDYLVEDLNADQVKNGKKPLPKVDPKI
jgi:hypothetical protein